MDPEMSHDFVATYHDFVVVENGGQIYPMPDQIVIDEIIEARIWHFGPVKMANGDIKFGTIPALFTFKICQN